MATIDETLHQVRARVARACTAAHRDVQSVTLLAVSKTFGADAIREAFTAGQRDFGENYVQEALEKISALADLRGAVRWHLIGALQTNKTRDAAQYFDWVHCIDRLKIAQRLAAQRSDHLMGWSAGDLPAFSRGDFALLPDWAGTGFGTAFRPASR